MRHRNLLLPCDMKDSYKLTLMLLMGAWCTGFLNDVSLKRNTEILEV